MIAENLKKILSNNYDIDVEKINADLVLRSVLDSIDFLNFILDLRKQYHFEIDSREVQRLHTFEDVVKMVEQHKDQF